MDLSKISLVADTDLDTADSGLSVRVYLFSARVVHNPDEQSQPVSSLCWWLNPHGCDTTSDARSVRQDGSRTIPANTRHSPDAVSMLGQRRRRWTNIETAMGECRVIAYDVTTPQMYSALKKAKYSI